MPRQPVRLALVNDFELVVAGLAHMLEPYSHRVVVRHCEPSAFSDEPVDIALCDTFAAAHGKAVDVAGVKEEANADRVVVYCWALDRALVEAALGQGASGYLSKKLRAEELVDALERIHAGEVVVARGTQDDGDPREPREGDWPGRAEGLSERESEILVYITAGLSNQDLADRAYLSINTVKSYIRSAYRKIGVASRSQAVLWAIDHGFRGAPQSRPDPAEAQPV